MGDTQEGKSSMKEMKRKRYADVPMEGEGGKTSKKKIKMKMERKRKRKRYCAEGRNTIKKKMKMEVERKSPIEEEEEGTRTHGKKKMKRKRYADIPMEEEKERKKRKREKCCVDIPMDVLIDILSRLPAMCVWRLRSVCKDWKSHIESPSFADLQLLQSKEEDTLFMVWARGKFRCESDPYHKTRFYSINYKDNGKAFRVGKEEFLHPNVAKASSINGLVCYYGSDGKIKVCNPATRELVNLPNPSFFLPKRPKTSPFDIGIGFDSTTKTYKVLAVPCGSTSEVEIFTLGPTSCWRILQLPGKIEIYDIFSQGLYANGCLFWFTSEYYWWDEKTDPQHALMTFNFAQEKFEFVPLPPDFDFDIPNKDKGDHWIREVRGRVCLIEAKRHKGMVKMWILANSGTQVWVDHHAVLPSFDDDFPEPVLYPIPNGVILFKKANLRRYICFYNEQGQVVKSIKVDGLPRRFHPVQHHTESLVSLRSILAPNL